jgi:1-acyl-sn-glycerol-3-phosphate acyltransferase
MEKISEIAIARSMRLIARALAAGRLKTFASGIEHIPSRGPVLVVARHYHHLFDGLALYAALPRPMHILVTLDWVKSRWSGRSMQWLTGLARWPVILREDALQARRQDRDGVFTRDDVVRFQHRALRESVQLLVEGRVLVVFPEGYPNIDPAYTPKSVPDQFLPFKAGFAAIAAAAHQRLADPLPIVPVGLSYHPGRPWIVNLKFGDPVYWTEFASRDLLIRFVEKEVKSLSGTPAPTDYPGVRSST